MAPDWLNGRGIIQSVVGSKFITPLGKLTFCIYLNQFGCINMSALSIRQSNYATHENFTAFAAGDLVMTILIAVVLNIFVDGPCAALEKKYNF